MMIIVSSHSTNPLGWRVHRIAGIELFLPPAFLASSPSVWAVGDDHVLGEGNTHPTPNPPLTKLWINFENLVVTTGVPKQGDVRAAHLNHPQMASLAAKSSVLVEGPDFCFF
jgi:hypothetical protein